ncbi:MAG: hypothetical protein JNM43_03835 [Planctomycetaceae bacterium]|nr:hypothetical protein [Planctomycetaceae bacterium]
MNDRTEMVRARVRLPQQNMATTALEEFLWSCETPEAPMVIRVVLRFSGDADTDEIVNCLPEAFERHPLLLCSLDTQPHGMFWRGAEGDYATVPVRVCQSTGSVLEAIPERFDGAIDLRIRPALKLEVIRYSDGVLLQLDAHHAAVDGNGLRQFLTDWMHLYHCRRTGQTAKLPQLEPERLKDRHQIPLPKNVEPTNLREAIRNFLVTVRGRTARWGSRQKTDDKRQHVWECRLDESEYQQILDRLASFNGRLNDLVMAESMAVFAAMSGAPKKHFVTVLNPTEMRLLSDRFLPAANRFGIALMRRSCEDLSKDQRVLSGLQSEMDYVRGRGVGADFVRGLESTRRFPSIARMARKLGWLVPSFQWTCLGDVTRGARHAFQWREGCVYVADMKLEFVTGFAPAADFVPLSIAGCEACRRMTLSIRSLARYLSQEQTEEFGRRLVARLLHPQDPDGGASCG